ncbi:MAG: DegV family protein [Lachnospiraceae bacterium]
MNYKIVSDSASNLISMKDFPYESVPLHIMVGEKTFTDDSTLDIHAMYEALASYNDKSSTSCPSPDDWYKAFGDADAVFCVTITSGLSGSCSSAHTAKQMYEEKYPERKVYIVDSLSTGPEMILLIEKIKELIKKGEEAEEIYKEVTAYHKRTHLFYALASLNNLAKNGRVSPLVAKGISVLGIRIIGTASEEGTLKPVNKARGDKKAMQKLVGYMKSLGYKNGKIVISHSDNLSACEELKRLIQETFGKFNGFIHENTALCGYYAELHSVLVGFEV